MLRSVCRRPSPAVAISSVALFLALGGGAFAAAGSDNAKDKRIAKSVVTQLAPGLSVAHAATADSANSASHASSADSATNAASLGGQPASSFVQYGTLASGKTETGVFGVRGTMPSAGIDQPDEGVSFAIPLASAPTVGSASDCTGSVTNPTAAPGKFCYYISQTVNNSGLKVLNPENPSVFGASRFGVVLYAESTAAGDKIIRGTWAVTAP